MYKPRILVTPSDPLLLDRSIDVFFAGVWALYAAWGLSASILGVATITDAVSPVYTFLWALSIGVLSSVACLSAISLFFDLGTRLRPPVKKRVELWAVRVLACIVGVYPVLLVIAAVSGDPNRGPSAVLAFLYVLIPYFRGRMLRKRIRNFERATQEILTNGTA